MPEPAETGPPQHGQPSAGDPFAPFVPRRGRAVAIGLAAVSYTHLDVYKRQVVNGFGVEAGKPLASSARIAKIAFTGETTTGRLIMQYASQNLIPVTLELGGKSPNIFFADVADERDAFYDKALEAVSYTHLDVYKRQE